MSDDAVKMGNINPPGNNILVQELDLSYAVVPYSRALKRGAALTQAYGDRVGYRYYQDEECGIFWSNDPHTTIHKMLDKLGLDEIQDEYRRAAEFYHKAGVTGY
ncbi:MAG TPA: hypothetical protein VG206_26765 [Terriglobia bacterium]|nr:hypothetical protein [Terriglobia bacterium]